MSGEPRFKVVATTTGAPALLDRSAGEVMHPVIGPLAESRALYVEGSKLAHQLARSESAPLVVFDVGLGAGGNAAAAWLASEDRHHGRPLHIVSFDRTCEALETAANSDQAPALGLAGSALAAAHSLVRHGEAHGARTRWTMVSGELPHSLERAPEPAHVIFWDPYSPKVNPELWSISTFEGLRVRCHERATLHTYSASTTVRAALLLAGFYVGAGPAVGSKRETTTAARTLTDLDQPLGGEWLSRLQRSSASAPEGAADEFREAVTRHRQFRSLAPASPK